MSLFKTRDWWSTRVGEDEEFDLGCLCVSDVDSTGKDRVIVGSLQGCLRVYQPSQLRSDTVGGAEGSIRPDDLLCELRLGAPIIQVEAAHFVSIFRVILPVLIFGSPDLRAVTDLRKCTIEQFLAVAKHQLASNCNHVAVLHPRKLSVYGLTVQTGMAEHGAQYQMHCMYEHKLQRSAFNLCFGPFGGVKGRDFLCVQSVDGTLSIFEQETFAFSRFLPGALLPGPLRYAPRTDSFLTVSTGRQVESYKLQALAMANDSKASESQSLVSGKRLVPDWIFLINEPAIDLVVTNFNGVPSTVFILGERNLYALTDAGQLCFMKKFDFNPSCFLPYALAGGGGGAGGAGEGICYMVATHSKSLLLLQGVTLKWVAQIQHVPVQLRISSRGEVKGAVVLLDDEGHVQCSYLGTDPSMFARPPVETRELDYARANTEMSQLQKSIAEQQGKTLLPGPTASTDDDLKITVSVSPNLDRQSRAVESELEDEEPIPSITAIVTLTAKTRLQDVKLNINVQQPLAAYNGNSFSFSIIEVHNPIETAVTFYMKQKMLPPDLKADVTATYYSSAGAPRVVRASIRLPLTLVLRQCLPVKQAAHKLTIDTNKQAVPLNDLFAGMLRDRSEGMANVIGFKYYGLEPIVTILSSKTAQRYRVQADEFGFLWHLTHELVQRLSAHFRAGSDFSISCDGTQLPLNDYFFVIDRHFQSRVDYDELSRLLEDRAAQFRSVQKRLLTMYKDRTPTPLNNLDALLDTTYKQILALADRAEASKQQQAALSAELAASTRLVCLLVRLSLALTAEDYALLQAALTPIVIDGSVQGWEEVVEASTTHVLRTTFAKNAAKDSLTGFNSGPIKRLKDTEKLKKLISTVCDRMGKGGRQLAAGSNSVSSIRPPTNFEHPPDNHNVAGRKQAKQHSGDNAALPDSGPMRAAQEESTDLKTKRFSADRETFDQGDSGTIDHGDRGDPNAELELELNDGGRSFLKKPKIPSPTRSSYGDEEMSRTDKDELVYGL